MLTTGGSATSTINFVKPGGGTQTLSTTTSGINGGTINYVVGDGSTTTNTLQLLTNAPLGTTSTISVSNKASLDVQTFVISGSATTISAGATLITANLGGVSGSVTTNYQYIYEWR